VRRQLIFGEPSLEPGIGLPQPGLACLDLGRVGLVPQPAAGGIVRVDEMGCHDALHVPHHVIVEHAVDHARGDRLGRVGWDQRRRSGMVNREMFDDRGRFDHGRAAVKQDRKLACRMHFPEEIGFLLVARGDAAEIELGAVGIECDERFPRIGREGVTDEFQAHQLPSSIFARRSSSSSLGGLVSNVPVWTSPAGS